MPVQFFYQQTAFRLPQPGKARSWIKKLAAAEQEQVGELVFVFCSDPVLQRLNQTYLRHHALTDIITFQYHQKPAPLHGEVYISIERVRENAQAFGVPFQTELRRVMAHGVLHLCGYQDKTPRQQQRMRTKEESCLSLWKQTFHVKHPPKKKRARVRST